MQLIYMYNHRLAFCNMYMHLLSIFCRFFVQRMKLFYKGLICSIVRLKKRYINSKTHQDAKVQLLFIQCISIKLLRLICCCKFIIFGRFHCDCCGTNLFDCNLIIFWTVSMFYSIIISISVILLISWESHLVNVMY